MNVSTTVGPYFLNLHCVKSVRIRSFFWSVFPLFGLNTGKYGAEKTPYLDTFHAVLINKHFQPHHKFSKIFSRNNMKVSFSCIPNMKSINHIIILNAEVNLALGMDRILWTLCKLGCFWCIVNRYPFHSKVCSQISYCCGSCHTGTSKLIWKASQ